MKSSKPAVLCLEADTTGVYIRKMLLEQAGYEVMVATDILLAKKLLGANKVHVVVVDGNMLGTNKSLAAELKQLNPRVSIVVLSPYDWLPSDISQEVDAVHTQLAPPDELLAKLKDIVS